jgi:hypothetical protein
MKVKFWLRAVKIQPIAKQCILKVKIPENGQLTPTEDTETIIPN